MISSLDHHAYVVVGSRDSIVDELLNILESRFQIRTNGNPDCTLVHFESLGIDESRQLKEMQSARSLSGGKKIFVVSTNAITVQAQNSMLKMLEEPAESTHFFIVVPSVSFFIDTLLSRVVKINAVSQKEDVSELNPKKFLTLSYSERLKVVEKFLKTYKDSKENKSMVHTFLSGLEAIFAKDVKGNKESIEKLLEIKKYVFDTSSSLKILLETTALILPIK